ncbi:GNAT family N-acetyltransferase [Streptomyces varsoviensis]|uniref:GNAT family N-acetyltransferase n=1 Tax=Streptomyces varsoviensis TaxID=67373 RepID=UPI003407924E
MIERTALSEEFVHFNQSTLFLHYGIHQSEPVIRAKLALAEPDGFLAVRDRGIVAGAVSRRLTMTVRPGRTLPATGLGEIAVLPSHRRRGLLRELMRAHQRTSAEAGHAFTVLNASEGGIYGRFGYAPVTTDSVWTLDPRTAAIPRTAPCEVELLDAAAARTALPPAFDAYQRATPAELAREPAWWRTRFDCPEAVGAPADQHCVLARGKQADGAATGYALWRRPAPWSQETGPAPVIVDEFIAPDHTTTQALLAFFTGLDLCDRVEFRRRPLTAPLHWRFADPRSMRLTGATDRLWVRLLDVPAVATACLTGLDAPLTLRVHDANGPADGAWDIEPGPYGPARTAADLGPEADGLRVPYGPGCAKSRRGAADLELEAGDLAAVLLAGTDVPRLMAAGRLVEHTSGSALRLARALAGTGAPHCSTVF